MHYPEIDRFEKDYFRFPRCRIRVWLQPDLYLATVHVSQMSIALMWEIGCAPATFLLPTWKLVRAASGSMPCPEIVNFIASRGRNSGLPGAEFELGCN